MTEEDVAARLGISRATVSRALHGRGRVSAATRERVAQAAAELGYIPNVMASELAAGRSDTIGLLLRAADNPAYGLLLTELQKEARMAGLEVVTVTAPGDVGSNPQIAGLRRLLGMRVSGLIVATGDVPSERLLPFRDDVPMIRAGRPDTHPDIHAIAYDEEGHARMLVEQVVSAGHLDVAVLTPGPETSYPESVRASAAARFLEGRGCVPRVVPVQARTDGVNEVVRMAQSGDVTAVMCPSDLRALEVLRAARGRIRVPRDLTVTGCDGILPGIDIIGLTSVRLPVEMLASRVIQHLTGMLAESPQRTVHEVLRGQLITGETVGPPRTPLPRVGSTMPREIA